MGDISPGQAKRCERAKSWASTWKGGEYELLICVQRETIPSDPALNFSWLDKSPFSFFSFHKGKLRSCPAMKWRFFRHPVKNPVNAGGTAAPQTNSGVGSISLGLHGLIDRSLDSVSEHSLALKKERKKKSYQRGQLWNPFNLLDVTHGRKLLSGDGPIGKFNSTLSATQISSEEDGFLL